MNDSGSRSTVGTKKKHHANLSKQQTKLRKVCWSKKEKKKCWKRIYRQQQSRVDEEQRKPCVLDDQPLQLSYLTSYLLSKSESRPDRLFITVKRSPQAKQICISHMEESTATANQKNIWQIWHDVFIAFYSKVHLNDLLMIYGLWDFSRVCLLISKKSNN